MVKNKDDWPIIKLPNNIPEEFKLISRKKHFIKIFGNIKNWEKTDLKMYNEWILPNAIILFGKPFYNKRVKDQIINQQYDNNNLNKRAEITQISEQINKSLQKCKNKDGFNIEQYILKSLKNSFANLNECRIKKTICPMCLITPPYIKTHLEKNGDKYFCERCKNICKSWMLYYNNPKRKIKKKDILNKISRYINFIELKNATCVCPNNECKGKFIPINLNLNLTFGDFIDPPENIKNNKIVCPYCDISFIIGDVVKKSGFKKMSGCLTGLPQTTIFEKIEVPILEEKENNIPDLYKTFYLDKLDLIRKQILMKKKLESNSKIGNINNHLYDALNNWIIKNYDDAYDYFFLNKSIDFSDILTEFVDIYKDWENLDWLCRSPKFSHGPIDCFKAVVKNRTISNNTSIRGTDDKKPKILKVLSLMKDKDYVSEVIGVGQTIKLKGSELRDGDEVLVEALFIPPKCNNSFVQRIIRLKKELGPFILRIEKEESGEDRDNDFWNEWNRNNQISGTI